MTIFFTYHLIFNPLPKETILYMTKLKAFADGKGNLAKMTISLFDKIREHCGEKERMMVTSIPPPPPPPVFLKKKAFFRVNKSGLCGKGLIIFASASAFKKEKS